MVQFDSDTLNDQKQDQPTEPEIAEGRLEGGKVNHNWSIKKTTAKSNGQVRRIQ